MTREGQHSQVRTLDNKLKQNITTYIYHQHGIDLLHLRWQVGFHKGIAIGLGKGMGLQIYHFLWV